MIAFIAKGRVDRMAQNIVLLKRKHTLCVEGLGTIPKMKTERFGGQPERSVFPVWVLTGFACCSARKSRLSHAVFASVATLAMLALPLIIALTRTFVLVIIRLKD